MATRRKPADTPETVTVDPPAPTAAFPDADGQVVITATIDAVIEPVELVGPEPERLDPAPGWIDTAPDIAVFAVVDDDDAERRRAIDEWKRVTPRSERLRRPFDG